MVSLEREESRWSVIQFEVLFRCCVDDSSLFHAFLFVGEGALWMWPRLPLSEADLLEAEKLQCGCTCSRPWSREVVVIDFGDKSLRKCLNKHNTFHRFYVPLRKIKCPWWRKFWISLINCLWLWSRENWGLETVHIFSVPPLVFWN